jgi:hypothetical protein
MGRFNYVGGFEFSSPSASATAIVFEEGRAAFSTLLRAGVFVVEVRLSFEAWVRLVLENKRLGASFRLALM